MATESTPQENLALGLALAGALVPALGPKATEAYNLGMSLLQMALSSVNSGEDVTDAEIDALLDADAELVAADLRAQAIAIAGGDTSGG